MAVVVKSYLTPADEMMGIAQDIQQLIQQGSIQPNEIAVIYHENKYLDDIAEYLQYEQIPFKLVRNENLLRNYFIQQVILLFEWIAYEAEYPGRADHHLYKLLHFRWFGLDAEMIARMHIKYVKLYNIGQKSFYLFIHEQLEKDKESLAAEEMSKWQSVINLLGKWLGDVYSEPLQYFFCKVLAESGILRLASQADDRYYLIHLLKTLFDFLKAENERNPDLDLRKWIDVIRKMESYRLSIPCVSQMGNDNAVQLLTAHGAKGLEFDYVFIGGCWETNWEKKSGGGIGFALPPNLKSSMMNMQEDGAKIEDKRRLFYVALTRARKQVTISYAEQDKDKKTINRSRFVDEINIPPQVVERNQKSIGEFNFKSLHSRLYADIHKQYSEQFIKQLIAHFRINPTALNKYLYCPRSFFYESLLQVPQAQQAHSIYGQAMHHALKHVAKRFQQENLLNIDQAKDDFEWYMNRHRYHFTADDLRRRLEHGKQVLEKYLNDVFPKWGKVKQVEEDYQAQLGHIPIKGRIDKVEIHDGQIRVVDYKTGNPDRAGNKLKRYELGAVKQKQDDYDYWIQAIFYAILLRKNGIVVNEVFFDFVEPNGQQEFIPKIINVDDEAIETVSKCIECVWEKIQSQVFPNCEHDDCVWCSFEQSLSTDVLPLLSTDEEPSW
ncbi:MAG: PD-(D/E)XK nuclease family protein [Thermoflavifilum sp.]|nr:PD-(D/E)XK nuclease family protein [Thermoflavifilum sp.]